MRESAIQAQVITALLHFEAAGRLVFWRQNVGMARPLGGGPPRFYGRVGCPDLIGVLAPAGRFFGVELKAATKQSAEQLAFQAAFERCGGLYVVGRGVQQVLHDLGLVSSLTPSDPKA